jgi:hercynine metabolism small protein
MIQLKEKVMSMTDTKTLSQQLRFKFYHELQDLYHRCFDELAESDLAEGEAARLAQTLLLSRQEGLKYLVDVEDLAAYSSVYPEDL